MLNFCNFIILTLMIQLFKYNYFNILPLLISVNKGSNQFSLQQKYQKYIIYSKLLKKKIHESVFFGCVILFIIKTLINPRHSSSVKNEKAFIHMALKCCFLFDPICHAVPLRQVIQT